MEDERLGQGDERNLENLGREAGDKCYYRSMFIGSVQAVLPVADNANIELVWGRHNGVAVSCANRDSLNCFVSDNESSDILNRLGNDVCGVDRRHNSTSTCRVQYASRPNSLSTLETKVIGEL